MGLAGSVCPTWLRSAVTLRSGAGPPPPIVDIPAFIAGASAPWREMYTWGTEVALGYVPQTNISAQRIHFANRGWGLVRESVEGRLLRTRGRGGLLRESGEGRVSATPRYRNLSIFREAASAEKSTSFMSERCRSAA